MISRQQFAIVLGFAFGVVWVLVGFGDALLCLLAAAVFWAVDAYRHGELDLSRFSEPR